MGKIKIAFVVMVLITIAVGIAVAYATSTNQEEEMFRNCFEAIKAIPLDEEPAYYNGDNASFCFYVIEALENPGTWIEADVWLYNRTSHEWIDEDGIGYWYPGLYVKYDGDFYMIELEFKDPPLTLWLSEEIINQTPKMVGGMAVGWGAFAVAAAYVKHKQPATKSLET